MLRSCPVRIAFSGVKINELSDCKRVVGLTASAFVMKSASFISTPRNKRTYAAGLIIEQVGIRVRGGQRGLGIGRPTKRFNDKMRCSVDLQNGTTHLSAARFVAKNDHTTLGDVYKYPQNLNSLYGVALPDIRKANSLPVVDVGALYQLWLQDRSSRGSSPASPKVNWLAT